MSYQQFTPVRSPSLFQGPSPHMVHVSQPGFGNGGGAMAYSPHHHQSSGPDVAFHKPPRILDDSKDFFMGGDDRNAKRIYKLVHDPIENNKFIRGFASTSTREVVKEELWELEMTASNLDSKRSKAIQFLQRTVQTEKAAVEAVKAAVEAAEARLASTEMQLQHYQGSELTLANFVPNVKERSKQVCDVVDGKKPVKVSELLVDIICERLNLESDPVENIQAALYVRNHEDIEALEKNVKYYLLTVFSAKKYHRNPAFKPIVNEYKRSGVISGDVNFLDSMIYGATSDNEPTLDGFLLIYLRLVPAGYIGFKRQTIQGKSPWTNRHAVFSGTSDVAGVPPNAATLSFGTAPASTIQSGFGNNVVPPTFPPNAVQNESFGAQGCATTEGFNFGNSKGGAFGSRDDGSSATPKYDFSGYASDSKEATGTKMTLSIRKKKPEVVAMDDPDL